MYAKQFLYVDGKTVDITKSGGEFKGTGDQEGDREESFSSLGPDGTDDSGMLRVPSEAVTSLCASAGSESKLQRKFGSQKYKSPVKLIIEEEIPADLAER
jgi:hypothetical protein